MRASDRAYRALRTEIVEWRLRPGAVLGEVEQSSRLGVSRTPLREALTRLTAEGLVAPQAGRGLVVTGVSANDVRELFEVRRALEEQAARLAAERADTAVFATLAREFAEVPTLLQSRSQDPDRHAYYQVVARLDAAIDDAVSNSYLVAALQGLRTHLERARRLAKDNPARLASAAAEHGLIAHAIANRDAELAAHATHVHLHNALQSVLAAIEPAAATAQDERDAEQPATASAPPLATAAAR